MTNQPETVIRIKNLSKTFRIPLDRHNDLKEKLVSIFQRRRGYRQFKALDNISFTVNKGDFFGVVGRNGSGKSTLLKILARIYVPDSGVVNVRGSLMPFIELGVGFNDKLSARENVYLNGAMIGFSRREMDSLYEEIVDFAELHDFMEERLKNFSSGMKVRLAFSIAIRAKSDILLLDEVLAVGDTAFREKCNTFFKEQKGKRTIILVTHDMNAVEEFCNRALFLNNSKITKIGTSSDIAAAYNDLFAKEKQIKLHLQNSRQMSSETASQDIKLTSISITQNDQVTEILQAKQDFVVSLEFKSPRVYEDVAIGIKVFNSQGLWYMGLGSRNMEEELKIKKGKTIVKFYIQNVLTNDDYTMDILIKDNVRDGLLVLYKNNIYKFSVQGIDIRVKNSLVHPNVQVEVL